MYICCIIEATLGQTNLICCFSSAPASTSNTPLQLSLLPFASGTPPINAINNHVMSRETSLMASAHGHLNNEVMNNNRPPAPKFRKWLMRNNKSSLSGLNFKNNKHVVEKGGFEPPEPPPPLGSSPALPSQTMGAIEHGSSARYTNNYFIRKRLRCAV